MCRNLKNRIVNNGNSSAFMAGRLHECVSDDSTSRQAATTSKEAVSEELRN